MLRTYKLGEADRILVLDAGRVVGDGTHEQLLADCPTYQETAKSQNSNDGIEND